MASAFRAAFERVGRPIVQLRSRARRWPAVARPPAGGVLWILAVTDGAIEATARRVVDEGGMRRGDVVLHLAGMLGPTPLRACAEAGAGVGAFHPLIAVASARRPPPIEGLAATLEGDARAWRAARWLGGTLGLSTARIVGVRRARYHAAAALVASGAVALAQQSAALMNSSGTGFGDKIASRAAASLLRSAAHNVESLGARRALASPLLRGDVPAIERHFAEMRENPGALGIYLAVLDSLVSSLASDRAVAVPTLKRVRQAIARARSVPVA